MSTLTLTHPTAGPGSSPLVLTLPEQLAWPDEFTWQQVAQQAEYTTTGALVLDTWAKQAGRPITLAGSETRAWCERGVLLTLRAWASQPGVVFALTGLRGIARQVVFNHEAGALGAEPILDHDNPADDEPYVVTLRFLEL